MQKERYIMGAKKIAEEQVTYKHIKIDENGNKDVIWTDSKEPPESYKYAKEKRPKQQ